MGRFAMKSRGPGSDALGELTNEQRAALPPRFEAVGEALASGAGATEAVPSPGRRARPRRGVARRGARRADGHLDPGARPRPGVRRAGALSTAWSEATLGYLHRLSCDDPLTGLASLPHLRSRLSELYRARERSPERPGHPRPGRGRGPAAGDEGLEQRMTAGPGGPHRAHRLRRQRDHRPDRACAGSWSSPSATSSCRSGSTLLRTMTERDRRPGSGSRACPAPTRPPARCSTSSPAR